MCAVSHQPLELRALLYSDKNASRMNAMKAARTAKYTSITNDQKKMGPRYWLYCVRSSKRKTPSSTMNSVYL